MTKLKVNHNEIRSDGTVIPDRTKISDISTRILANVVRIIGHHVSRGFKYDIEIMSAKMAKFRKEMKNVLRMLANTKRAVELQHCYNFLKHKDIIVFMLTAQVAENVKKHFNKFVKEMEQKELAEFNKRFERRRTWRMNPTDRKQHKYITDKFRRLKRLVAEMTKAEKFNRITSFMDAEVYPTTEVREAVEFLKQHLLLPIILGRTVTASNGIQRKIAVVLAADTGEAGFMGRFVEEVAQHQLELFKDTRWIIVDDDSFFLWRWLFYTESDFKWESLRRTTSGIAAINYYVKNILMPRMLGVSIDDATLKSRQKEFYRLIKVATGEN